MSRPTADDCYSRAKGALDSAEAAASNTSAHRSAPDVGNLVMVAQGWQSLAESLASAERATRRRGTVIQ